MLDGETQWQIEAFLFEEARLLDDGDFEGWLTLYEPQGIYWIPSKPGQTDPLNVASIIYEDHGILSIRVQRLLEERALVLTPMPRTSHLYGNIVASVAGDGTYKAAAVFICIIHQDDRQRMYSGRLAYDLVRHGDSFRIKLKCVRLMNADGVHTPMAIPF